MTGADHRAAATAAARSTVARSDRWPTTADIVTHPSLFPVSFVDAEYAGRARLPCCCCWLLSPPCFSLVRCTRVVRDCLRALWAVCAGARMPAGVVSRYIHCRGQLRRWINDLITVVCGRRRMMYADRPPAAADLAGAVRELEWTALGFDWIGHGTASGSGCAGIN